jgi:hypothetical protein
LPERSRAVMVLRRLLVAERGLYVAFRVAGHGLSLGGAGTRLVGEARVPIDRDGHADRDSDE